jgi:CxxC motif-containing protein (DUF1111 family)
MRALKGAGRWVTAWIGAVVLDLLLLSAQAPPTAPGDPLPGLTPVELAQFREGRDEIFLDEFEASHGLGPAFNGTSCSECHNLPAVGGTGVVLETHAAYRDGAGVRGLDSAGDTLIHLFSVPPHACQPVIPRDANVVARRASIPLFGAGLIEAIPDETLRGLEDPVDRNGDGARGRAAIVVDLATGERRVGRFGWKAQHASLLAFSADAFRNEMGIPNALLDAEYAFGFSDLEMVRCNGTRGIAARDFLEGAATFMRLLAPVARGPIDDAVRDGERLFNAIGCAACHVPTLTTGPSANPLFDSEPVPLFSDLLLHDVGTGDGIPQAAARPEELRTPALWGLRLRRPFLHDGSAATIEEAILRHSREAELAQRGFLQMAGEERARLLAFLRSL